MREHPDDPQYRVLLMAVDYNSVFRIDRFSDTMWEDYPVFDMTLVATTKYNDQNYIPLGTSKPIVYDPLFRDRYKVYDYVRVS